MKIDISKLHLEILDKKRQELLENIIPLTKDFILGGGTALSLQISHRKSFDFDFFSEKEIPKSLLSKISKYVNVKTTLYNTGDELTFYDSNDIKFTFLSYPFKTFFESLEVVNGLKLFSIKEIALKKAYTIGRRGEYRDYFDLYTVLKNNYITLETLINTGEVVYKGLFNSKLFLSQLTYFKDLQNFDIIPVEGKELSSVDEVKNYLESVVDKYTSENT